jgi:hypothetical protein
MKKFLQFAWSEKNVKTAYITTFLDLASNLLGKNLMQKKGGYNA